MRQKRDRLFSEESRRTIVFSDLVLHLVPERGLGASGCWSFIRSGYLGRVQDGFLGDELQMEKDLFTFRESGKGMIFPFIGEIHCKGKGPFIFDVLLCQD